MKAKFEIYKAKDGWRWRLIGANGEVVASGESHHKFRYNARRAAKRFAAIAKDAEIVETITS